jgi:hypothetical protein
MDSGNMAFSVFCSVPIALFLSGLRQPAQSTCWCWRSLYGCHYQQVCEHDGYTQESMLGWKCKEVYSVGLRTTTCASFSIFLRYPYVFMSCGPHLRCKPCPDKITVTAINMSRWEGSVSNLKIIWRSMHNKLYTLKFPWNILFWSCKKKLPKLYLFLIN